MSLPAVVLLALALLLALVLAWQWRRDRRLQRATRPIDDPATSFFAQMGKTHHRQGPRLYDRERDP